MASSHANFVALGPGKGYHLGEALSSENGPLIVLKFRDAAGVSVSSCPLRVKQHSSLKTLSARGIH